MSILRRRILGIVGTAFGAGSVFACSSGAKSVQADYEESLCNDLGGLDYMSDLKPSLPVDYVALREGGWDGSTPPTVVQESGKCTTDASCIELMDAPG